MKNFKFRQFLALTWLCGLTCTALGQVDVLGYGDAPGMLTHDLLSGPEWRSYQSIAPPVPSASIRPPATQSPPPMPVSTPASVSSVPMLKQTDYALRFFGGDSARQTLQQMPQRPQSTARSFVPVGRQAGKPFQNASNGATISPYLNLDRPENSEELPNYFTFVRPQFEQQSVNRRQQREMQKLERQVQATSYTAPASGSGMPGTGHGTRFGNTGRYYGGWRR
jgi:hypothetical protein